MSERRRILIKHYIKVEYLQSNGTQYINTRIIPNASTKLRIDMAFTSINDLNDAQNGIMEEGKRFHIGEYEGSLHWGIGSMYGNFKSFDTSRHTFELNGNGIAKLDSSTAQGSEISGITTPIYICTRNDNGVASLIRAIKGKFYGFQIYNNSTLLLDCIPVRVGQEGYMLDKVSGSFFGNAGTGSFILGPDV